MKNSKAWIIWLMTCMFFILSNRNPFYLTVILIGLLVLGSQLAQKKGHPSWLANNIRFLGTMILLSAVVNALFIHRGNTVIFKLPESWLLIGGKITFESLVFGMINGFVIGSLYIAFNIFNLALSIQQITGLIPKVFNPIAITISIALTFFPSIQQRAREIKEAQMIRGNQMKRIVDWLPLLLPLLITSLENAFLLSESMSARGYHSQTKSLSGIEFTFPIIIATFLIFSGWVLRLYDYPNIISIILYIIGAIIILFSLHFSNRKILITHYREEPWKRNDVLVSVLLVATLFLWTLLQAFGRLPSTAFSPFPKISLPSIQLSGIAISFSPLLPLVFSDK